MICCLQYLWVRVCHARLSLSREYLQHERFTLNLAIVSYMYTVCSNLSLHKWNIFNYKSLLRPILLYREE